MPLSFPFKAFKILNRIASRSWHFHLRVKRHSNGIHTRFLTTPDLLAHGCCTLKIFFKLVRVPEELKQNKKKSDKRISLVSKRFSVLQREYENEHPEEVKKSSKLWIRQLFVLF